MRVFLLLLIAMLPAPAAETLYVSASGRAGWSGRLPEPNAARTDGPLPSPAAARDAIRNLRGGNTDQAYTVLIRGGWYFLSEPLVLAPQDSNTLYAAYPGERPILSGGRRIENWRRKGGVWTADAPWTFHQLFVSGRRAQRARAPNFGFYRIAGPSSQGKPFLLRYRGDEVRPAWAERGDVEVVALLAWAEIRMPIVAVDEVAHTATLAGNPRPSNKEVEARFYIENAPEAFDAPGEWYLDWRAHTVSYRPLRGEDMTKEEVIAPALPQLVRLEGVPEQGRFVENVTFRGLDFRHTDWSLPPTGYADRQAAIEAAAAFEAVGAQDCAIERCVFTEDGGYAAWFGRGSKRNRVSGNEIFDMGGGGIKIGETRREPEEAQQNFSNTISDNRIHDLGLVYPAAVGVWVGQSSDNTIAHNDIHDLDYTAVSVGWTWGYGPNQCKGNRIEYNHLHHIGQQMLSDMGAIYTLGVQPGTVIRNNLIHDVSSFTYGGWGIYPDEGSSEMLIENNVVYRCNRAGFHQHYGRENVVRNNIFALNGDYEVMRTRAEPHLSFTFENNIVYYEKGRLLGGNWTGDQYRFDRNVYCDARGGEVLFAGKSFAEWQEAGQDKNSLLADPLFVDAGSFDFRLRPESPALRLGFKPIDLSAVGPRPRMLGGPPDRAAVRSRQGQTAGRRR